MSLLVAISQRFTVLPPLPEAADPLRRLVTQFRDQPRIVALVEAFAQQAQDLDDAMLDFQEHRWLDDAEGAQLDGLGRILALSRGAWTDDEYRARLRVRIRVLLADGTPEDIIGTLALLVGEGRIQLIETFPAELRIVFEQALGPVLSEAAVETARSIKPPGVRLWVEYGSGDPDAEEFAFAGGLDGAGFGEGIMRGVQDG